MVILKFLGILKFRNLFCFFNKIFRDSYFIIRLDDSCETQDFKKWNAFEEIFDELNIKPIVAVIPDNLDKSLKIDPLNKNFWDDVRRWESKGWTIGLHGYQHLFKEVKRRKLVLPFYSRSEFGGQEYEVQKNKIIKGYRKFKENNIDPKVWVAPAHTFDKNTLKIITEKTKIKIVSDGISFYPFRRKELLFVPQQMWSFKPRCSGVWTICLHPNNLSFQEINNIKYLMKNEYFHNRFISLDDAIDKERKIGFFSLIYRFYFWSKLRMKNILKKYF